MIRLALSSATLLSARPSELVRLAVELGLDGIEWAGDPHVPEGNPQAAWDVLMETLRAGLTVVSYAPLYRVSPKGEAGIPFSSILATAQALNAPLIRVYAGSDPRIAGPARLALIAELRRIAELAGAQGITIALSLGRRTCLESYAAARNLALETAHPFVRLAWEALPEFSDEEATRSLEEDVSSYILVHARRANRGGQGRGLSEDAASWERRLRAFLGRPGDAGMARFVVLGRLGEGELEQLRADSAFIKQLVAGLGKASPARLGASVSGPGR